MALLGKERTQSSIPFGVDSKQAIKDIRGQGKKKEERKGLKRLQANLQHVWPRSEERSRYRSLAALPTAASVSALKQLHRALQGKPKNSHAPSQIHQMSSVFKSSTPLEYQKESDKQLDHPGPCHYFRASASPVTNASTSSSKISCASC